MRDDQRDRHEAGRDSSGDRSDPHANQPSGDERERDAAKAKRAKEREHRLRTTSFGDDFQDADADSSAATIHRDDKISDS